MGEMTILPMWAPPIFLLLLFSAAVGPSPLLARHHHGRHALPAASGCLRLRPPEVGPAFARPALANLPPPLLLSPTASVDRGQVEVRQGASGGGSASASFTLALSDGGRRTQLNATGDVRAWQPLAAVVASRFRRPSAMKLGPSSPPQQASARSPHNHQSKYVLN
jgi:hypothetical protein